ncbi:MAG: sigma-70 family RNA polymerase sigma factor [Fermentimonas sp.]|nr:sigma-70 family RNA polymerase sigma factor [Fermentimonas sp.]
MNSQNVEIQLDKFVHLQEKIIVGIEEIPFPTAIFFLESKRVILNDRAYECLGLKVGEPFDIESWKRNNNNFTDIIINGKEDIISNQKEHIVLPNGKHEIINFSMAHIKNTYLNNIYILNFTKSIEKYSTASISSLYNIKDEISKLKPYLNRTGRNMVESLMKKYFRDDNQQLTLDDIVYYKKELREIQRAFPALSHREVILCGLLINNMETKDIASITNRTIDSVFVSIHRINKKLNLNNKKKLTETLKEVIFNSNVIEQKKY